MFTKVGFASVRSRVLSGRAVRGGLFGSGHKRAPVVLLALLGSALALAAPITASAGSNGPGPGVAEYVPGSLLAAAKASPDRNFQVIIEGKRGRSSERIADKVRGKGTLKKTFRSIGGVAAELSGREVLKLAGDGDVLAITQDAPVHAAAAKLPACSDRKDNDADGKIDANDPGCSGPKDNAEKDPAPPPPPPPPPACADGSDNDGDGLVDTSDPGCESSTDTDEYNPPPVCSDGSDNDGDGRVDGDDPGCESWNDDDEYNALPACADGSDNDGDGRVDGDDPGCESWSDEDEYDAPQGPDPFQTLGLWQDAIGVSSLWGHRDPWSGRFSQTPTIAIVDSGVDAGHADDFNGRVVADVNLSSLSPDATGDGDGHGTFVASLAAGSSPSYPGTAPGSDIVSIRVMNDEGMAMTSDVIAAADWILANKDAYGIRVANFSLHSGQANSFKFDPLNHAVERLWFSGVVVVTAAGNFGSGSGDNMYYAPANDPFVITVGAADIAGTASVADDTVAPWSAFGYTADGFAKPELVAPGRYMVAAVPEAGRRHQVHSDRVTSPGYMRMSGTSFSAPIVAGAAAHLLGLHPEWTPGQVKGALMLTARPINVGHDLADGVGEIDIAAAAAVSDAPDANATLNGFIVQDEWVAGGLSFDAAAWGSMAESDAAWASAAWASAAWGSAAWSSAAWGSAAWASAAWASAAWSSSSEADAALADYSQWDASFASSAWVD
jgi:serine protease AprX